MASISSFKFSITASPTSITVPSLKRSGIEKSIVVKNVGATIALRINFPGDSGTNYWTLLAGEVSPIFGGLRGGEIVTMQGVLGVAAVEVLIWEP